MWSRQTMAGLLAVLASYGTVEARENVKTFPPYECRYTLPGNDWSWADPIARTQAICVARNGDGLVFMLEVFPVPTGTLIDEKFAGGFEPSAYPSVKKHSGRITTFKGLSCYEWEWLTDGQQTAAFRVVIANGFAYQLQFFGGVDPVEKRPDFETIMNGFEFTSPPVPPDPLEPGKRVARLIGQVIVYCLAGFAVWGFVTMVRRRK